MHAEYFTISHHPEVNDAVASFVAQRIFGKHESFGPHSSMAVFDDRGLIGGIVYHNYHPDAGTLELSAASDDRRWVNRDILRKMFAFPFDVLGCQAVVARHSATAKHLRRIWRAFGAKEYTIPRLRGRDEPDEVIAVLAQEDWGSSVFMRDIVTEKV